MKQLTIQSSRHSYPVVMEAGLRFRLNRWLKKEYSSILVVTDDHVAERYLQDVLDSLGAENIFSYIVPAGEASKSIEQYDRLQTKAIESGLDRKSLLVALGGGVIGDLGGFVAATFMRGIDYIQIPTTILAHDSSVGGKVAINHELGKNLIGCFYPPAAVLYDTETLESLPYQEVRSGYAEILKEGLISNSSLVEELWTLSLKGISSFQLENHLEAGIKVKADIVEADEKEAGVRKYLNLGHTLGHALESTLGYGKVTHGEAVANGLLFAFHVSEDVNQHQLPFSELHGWMKKNEYPIINIEEANIPKIIKSMKSDKKSVSGRIQMVLLNKVGEPTVQNLDDSSVEAYMRTYIERMKKL
ncbi:3-dehydroquinate synthase [Oceanobacillus sp. J11TS1]|uniref:3-dehydroquinate synthase n=1 Tax=Oceanobacillus sp. J11TS1 TaxID=2807191 RepID=UPI001B21FEF5|nr:3-dehydroquinate synthase [Oceanobacillus sp. J11TS1]GIO22625.1 3-dehydroquinate synthase [Oceanobacillus sp. J11TS1]